MLCPGLVIQLIQNRAHNHIYCTDCSMYLFFSPLSLCCLRNGLNNFTAVTLMKKLVLGFTHISSEWKRYLQGNFTVMTLESDPRFLCFYFVFAGGACHGIRRCFANGPVWSGIRWLHAEPSVSSGCSHQHVWRPDGAWLQEAKAGVERTRPRPLRCHLHTPNWWSESSSS